MTNASFMDPDRFSRLVDLSTGTYHPREIVDLKAEIDGETRAFNVNFLITGIIDEERVRKIVLMRRKLDDLYVDWVNGKIS